MNTSNKRPKKKKKEGDGKKRPVKSAKVNNRRATSRFTSEEKEARLRELSTALETAINSMQALVDEDFSGSITNIADRVAYSRLMERVSGALREVKLVTHDGD